MRKGKITTTDENIYRALNQLRHQKEVVIEKPIEQRALDQILRNNENVIAISNGRTITLKRINDMDFDVYLKRIW